MLFIQNVIHKNKLTLGPVHDRGYRLIFHKTNLIQCCDILPAHDGREYQLRDIKFKPPNEKLALEIIKNVCTKYYFSYKHFVYIKVDSHLAYCKYNIIDIEIVKKSKFLEKLLTPFVEFFLHIADEIIFVMDKFLFPKIN